jgi:hypothetical protein
LNKLIFKQTKEEMFIGLMIKYYNGSLKQPLMMNFMIMNLNGTESELDHMKKRYKKYLKLHINNQVDAMIYIYQKTLILLGITKYKRRIMNTKFLILY